MAEETVQLTISVPDYVYRQALRVAEAQRRPLRDVITEALSQAFPTLYVSPDRPQMEQEEAAFRKQHSELLANYPGEFVAIHEGEIVGHDKDRLQLVSDIDKAYSQEVVLIKFVAPDPEDRVLAFRSPRLVWD